MSFKFYKFCQSGFITILSSIYAFFSLMSYVTEMSWWLCLLLAVPATLVWFLPLLGIFYPIAFAAYFIAAILSAPFGFDIQFIALVALFVLHLVRNISMLTFVRRNPSLSRDYDAAIRYGCDYDQLYEK